MGASSKLVWLEVVLIALFGTFSVGVPWFVETGQAWLAQEWGIGTVPARESTREQLELELGVAKSRDDLALIDQQLTALRAALVDNDVTERRNRSKAAALGQRHPEIAAATTRSSLPQPLQDLARAFDEATIAASSSAALEANLLREIDRLGGTKHGETKLLLDRQRQVTDKLEAAQRARARHLLRGCGTTLAALAAVAAIVACVLSRRRRIVATATVLCGVLGIGGAVCLSQLSPALGVGFAAASVLIIVAIAIWLGE